MLDTNALLHTLTEQVRHLLSTLELPDPALVGIHTGGVWVAQHLQTALGISTPLAMVGTAFHRDDFERIGLHANPQPTHLPFDVNGRHLILVDDVLHTGRSTRAALDELFSYGRPASVHLVVLVERPGRELPIQADAVGTHLDLSPQQRLKLSGPSPLQLHLLS